jgi:hypothetical protein
LAIPVGSDDGLIELMVAPGDTTVILKVMTIVETGVPQLIVTVPVRTWPGTAPEKTAGLNETPIGVPKL